MLVILLKEFIKSNANIKMIIKNKINVELNMTIMSATLNIQNLKMIYDKRFRCNNYQKKLDEELKDNLLIHTNFAHDIQKFMHGLAKNQ